MDGNNHLDKFTEKCSRIIAEDSYRAYYRGRESIGFSSSHNDPYGSMYVSGLIQSVLGAGKVVQDGAILITLLAFLVSLLSLAFAPNLVIRILTKGGGPAMEIRRKDGFFSFQHNEYTGFSQVIPGPDTNEAIKELGSLLREIQQTGTYADK